MLCPKLRGYFFKRKRKLKRINTNGFLKFLIFFGGGGEMLWLLSCKAPTRQLTGHYHPVLISRPFIPLASNQPAFLISLSQRANPRFPRKNR